MLFALTLAAAVLLGQPAPPVPPPLPPSVPQVAAPPYAPSYAGYAATGGGAAVLSAVVTGGIGWLLKGREIRAGSDAWFREYGAQILKEQRADDHQEIVDLKAELKELRDKLAVSQTDRDRLERKDADQQREIGELRGEVARLKAELHRYTDPPTPRDPTP